MSPPISNSFGSISNVALACICTLAVYGCSGSSDTGSGDVLSGGESAVEIVNSDDGTSNDVVSIVDEDSLSGISMEDVDGASNESTLVDADPSTGVLEPTADTGPATDDDVGNDVAVIVDSTSIPADEPVESNSLIIYSKSGPLLSDYHLTC